MEIISHFKHAPIGVMKANLVAKLLKGKDINKALTLLSFSQKKASLLIKGLLQSAVSNALEKKILDVDNLYIKSILINQAPSLKRYQPRAQGRASPIRKKRSHMTLILDEKISKKRNIKKTAKKSDSKKSTQDALAQDATTVEKNKTETQQKLTHEKNVKDNTKENEMIKKGSPIKNISVSESKNESKKNQSKEEDSLSKKEDSVKTNQKPKS